MSDENPTYDPNEAASEEAEEATATLQHTTGPKPYCDPKDVVKHHLRGMFQTWFLDYASYVIL